MLRDAGQRSIECFRRPRSALDASLPPILRAYLRNGFFGVQAFFACLLAYLALFFYRPSSQNPDQILVPTRPRCTTGEGLWLNRDLVGKWSYSPTLPFLQHAQTNPIPFPRQSPAFPSRSPDEHHPNPEPFFQSSLFQFPQFPQHMMM